MSGNYIGELDKFICENMQELFSNQTFKNRALMALYQRLSSVNPNTLSSAFCNKFINETFPTIYSVISQDPIRDVQFLIEFFLRLCLRNFQLINSNTKTILENILLSYPEIKRGFMNEFRQHIEMYTRDDQIKLIEKSGMADTQ